MYTISLGSHKGFVYKVPVVYQNRPEELRLYTHQGILYVYYDDHVLQAMLHASMSNQNKNIALV